MEGLKTSENDRTNGSSNILEIGSKWALLVGVNNYGDSSISSLNYCVNDIQSFYNTLIDPDKGKYKPENISLLSDINELKPMRNILISRLINMSRRAGSEDSILFYFSGHGYNKGDNSYLLCTDTYNNALDETAILITEIKNIMNESHARIKIIILDSCFSGAIKGIKDSGIMSKTYYESIFPAPEGFIVLSSCKMSEFSYEWDEKERSVFSYYLFEGMNGKAIVEDGIITLSNTYKYVFENVVKWAFSKNFEQTPMLEAKVLGEIPFAYSTDVMEEEKIEDMSVINKIEFLSQDYHFESNVRNDIQQFLGKILIYYKFKDIKYVNDTNYTFPNGEITIDDYPEEGDTLYYTTFSIHIRKNNIGIQQIIYPIICATIKWEYIYFNVLKQIDFNKLYDKCLENRFEIIKYNPSEISPTLDVNTEGWVNTVTQFSNINGKAKIKITSKDREYLGNNFDNSINLVNIYEFIKDILI